MQLSTSRLSGMLMTTSGDDDGTAHHGRIDQHMLKERISHSFAGSYFLSDAELFFFLSVCIYVL